LRFLIVLLTAALCISCRRSETGPSTPPTAEKQGSTPANATPPAASSSDPLAIEVPDGPAEELIQFISDVAQRTPRGTTDEERTQDIGRQMEARIAAADMLLEKDGGTHRLLARQTKLESLRVLATIGHEGAEPRFLDFAKELSSSSNGELQRLGRIGLYQAKLDRLIAQGPQGPESPPETIAALEQLLKQEMLDLTLLQTANETGLLFNQVGLNAESAKVFQLISEAFAGHENPELAKAAETAAAQAKMVQFNQQLQAFMQGDGQQGIDELAATLGQMTASPQLVSSLLSVAQNIEYSGKIEMAKSLYDLAAQMTSQLEAPQSEMMKEMLASAQTRLGLIGHEFSLTGVKSDGTPFAWEDYAGKIVLVDVWATWCRPCIEELPNVLENYHRFHEAGFEVVGVNIDEEPSDARAFLERRKLPWTTVISESDTARGFQDPNCVKHGVTGIPFLALVGRDGKVDSLHLRGAALGQRLAELLPAESNIGEEATGDVEVSDAPTHNDPSGGESANDEQEPEDILDEATETMPPDAATALAQSNSAADGGQPDQSVR
jgi:thiol-disulfide isomerase/thioredoxin